MSKSRKIIHKLEEDRHRASLDDDVKCRTSIADISATQVKRKTLISYLTTWKVLQDGSQSLPFSVVFSAFFLSAALLHSEVEKVGEVQGAILDGLGKRVFSEPNGGSDLTFADISVRSEMWAWLQGTAVPFIWGKEGLVTEYGTLFASPEIRQYRSQEEDCKLKKLSNVVYGKCHPVAQESKATFGNSTLDGFRYHPDEGAFWIQLPGSASVDQISLLMQQYDDEGWLDESTVLVSFDFVAQNPEYSLITLVRIKFQFERGGYMHAVMSTSTFHASWYLHDYLFAVDVLWLACVLLICTSEIIDMNRLFRQHRLRQYTNDRWNIFDWGQVLYSTCIIIYFLVVVKMSVDTREKVAGQDDPRRAIYDPTFSREIMSDARSIMWHLSNLRVIVAANVFILITRFFKAFHSQPRLAVVTHTFTLAFVDLTHFLIVVVTVWLCFVTSGMILFGPGMEDFSVLHSASTACLQLMLGETGVWFNMYAASPVATQAWFWPFWVVVILVLLNILIAIIIDQYTYVKSTVGKDAPSIWTQIGNSYTTLYLYLRGEMDTTKLLKKLQEGELRRATVINHKELQRQGQMSEVNALKLILSVKSWEVSRVKTKGITLSDALVEIPGALDRFNAMYFRIRQAETRFGAQSSQIFHLREQLRTLVQRVGGELPKPRTDIQAS